MSRSDGYTGRLFEEEVLGRCRVTVRGYMTWRAALEYARQNQPPHKTATAAELEHAVCQQTGKAVEFFTAVGTALDAFHGVDGVFVFEGVVVTIDVTCNPQKNCGKAHLIVRREDLEDLPALAGRIAREFEMQLSRRA